MKRLHLLLITLSLLPGISSCMKAYDAAYSDSFGGFTDAYLQISGFVMDYDTVQPVEGILVTLTSYLSGDTLHQRPVSSVTTYTDKDGFYRIRNRFNLAVYELDHILEFTDEDPSDGVYPPVKMDVSLSPASIAHAASGGYELDEINAFLSLSGSTSTQ